MVDVHPSLPVKSIGDLVRLAKAKPGAINYASAGTGTPTFMAAELFKGQAGVNMVHVPYKGGGEAMTSTMSGETTVYFPSITTAMPFVRRGSLRALAVTTAKRLPFLPQYPTVAEAGYPHYQSGNWYGLMVPAKTPQETIAAIRDVLVAALNDPAVGKRLSELGYVPIGDRPEEFAAHIKSEIAALAKVVRELRLSAD
jgi:tripartite-type tricarboxylate transporter receptor subunit TctC